MFSTAERQAPIGGDRLAALKRLVEIRGQSAALAANLMPEDQSIQSMPDASPTKWHLGHTTWFFETFILARGLDPSYRAFDPAFAYLFNSYYEAAGPRHPRPERGLLSRPTVDLVGAYRDHVTAAMTRFVERADEATWREIAPLLELGLQSRAAASGTDPDGHQARLFAQPAAARLSGAAAAPTGDAPPRPTGSSSPAGWSRSAMTAPASRSTMRGRGTRCGCEPFRLAVAAGQLRRISGIHRRRRLSPAGVLAVRRLGDGPRAGLGGAALLAPRGRGRGRSLRCPDGADSIRSNRCPMSAFMRPTPSPDGPGSGLPSEAEWEIAAAGLAVRGNFADSGRLHPAAEAQSEGGGLRQMFGDVWEWTASPYLPYPRFRAAPGAVGEYNGKFMCNQMVLRGGAAVTPGRASARHLSQFLSALGALGLCRVAAGGGRLMRINDARIEFHDLAPGEESFRDAVLKGLSGAGKSIPCKFLYDARGSALFEEIARLPEYYPTRTEIGILEDNAERDRRASGTARPADRVRQRRQPQGAHIARGARPAGGLCSGRHLAASICARLPPVSPGISRPCR